jgi:hypothetical protein
MGRQTISTDNIGGRVTNVIRQVLIKCGSFGSRFGSSQPHLVQMTIATSTRLDVDRWDRQNEIIPARPINIFTVSQSDELTPIRLWQITNNFRGDDHPVLPPFERDGKSIE